MALIVPIGFWEWYCAVPTRFVVVYTADTCSGVPVFLIVTVCFRFLFHVFRASSTCPAWTFGLWFGWVCPWVPPPVSGAERVPTATSTTDCVLRDCIFPVDNSSRSVLVGSTSLYSSGSRFAGCCCLGLFGYVVSGDCCISIVKCGILPALTCYC